MYKTKRRYKGEPVRPDPTVDPTENETGIYFTSADRSAWVSSYEPLIVERLLHHPNFKVEQLITMQIEKQECIVGVIGRLPIGAVRLGRATTKDNHELVVQVPGYRSLKPAQVNTQVSAGQAKRELPLNLPAKAIKAKPQPPSKPVEAKQKQKQARPSAKARRLVSKKPSRAKVAEAKKGKTKPRPVKRRGSPKSLRKRRR